MKKITGISSLLSVFLIAFVSTGKISAELVESHFVRATKYHKTDPGVDQWTARGQTSTQLRLPKNDKVVTNPNKIGNVAVDPSKVPEGSLVYETQTERFFVATTGGTAVIDRRSARAIARMRGLCKDHYNALVFDFYYPKEVVDNHFTECFVISHEGKRFRTLSREYQQKRLDPQFWIKHLEALRKKSKDKEEQKNLDLMLARLREMV